MLLDDQERRIMQRCPFEHYRDPEKPRDDFEKLIVDFFGSKTLNGQIVLELGPGHYDFGELLRRRGAVVEAADYEETVLELGRHKGFEVHRRDLRKPLAGFAGRFDGLFSRGTLNAFWVYRAPGGQREVLESMLRALKEFGWGWVLPWNGTRIADEFSQAEVEEMMATQRAVFSEFGFRCFDVVEKMRQSYAPGYATVDRVVFVRNLDIPEAWEQYEV